MYIYTSIYVNIYIHTCKYIYIFYVCVCVCTQTKQIDRRMYIWFSFFFCLDLICLPLIPLEMMNPIPAFPFPKQNFFSTTHP